MSDVRVDPEAARQAAITDTVRRLGVTLANATCPPATGFLLVVFSTTGPELAWSSTADPAAIARALTALQGPGAPAILRPRGAWTGSCTKE